MVEAFARQSMDADACRALVARLADDAQPFEVMDQLMQALCGSHAMRLDYGRTLVPAERQRTAAAWRQLVEEHADWDHVAIMDASDPSLRGDLVLNLRW